MEPVDNEPKENLAPITGSANITLEPMTGQATGIVYWAHELEQAIRDIGGDPESKAWDRWDAGHIFAAAKLAREMKAQYGEIAFRITPAPTQTIHAVTVQSTAQVFPPTITQSVTVPLETDVIGVVQPPATVTTEKRYVYVSGSATARASARAIGSVIHSGSGSATANTNAWADGEVVKGGNRHIVITDSGVGSDHVTVTQFANKGGRPSILTPEAEQSAIQLMRKGIPQEVVAGRLGVSVSTIKRVARRYRNR